MSDYRPPNHATAQGRCPDCGCPAERHNAVNRVDRNPFGGALVIAHCGADGTCWRAGAEFTAGVKAYLIRRP